MYQVLNPRQLLILTIGCIYGSWALGGNRNCGRPITDLGLDPGRILGDADAESKQTQDGEWPWQAALYVNNVFYCGATLISPEWLVTSALCTPFLNDLSVYIIHMGSLDLTKASANAQRRRVSGVYVHPNYALPSTDWDIALVRVSHPFTITDYVRTVCVPTEDMDSLYNPGRVFTVTGWEYTGKRGTEVEASTFNKDLCREVYAPDTITDNMACVRYPENEQEACAGDSGRPVVTKVWNRWYLTGIVGAANGCQMGNSLGVNTKMTAFVDWLKPIYNGREPEQKPSECRYDEFQCEDSWCIDYSIKCNGVHDEGCYYNTDEEFCGKETMYFDPIFGKKLHESAIAETRTVIDVEHCARLCLETPGYTCMAFDLKNHTCYLAGQNFDLVISTDWERLHFEMEKFPVSGTTITAHTGRISTPRWLPSMTSLSTSYDGLYIWIIKPDVIVQATNTIALHFRRKLHGDPATECKDTTTENYVVIRDGEEFNSPVVAHYCLNKLPETLEIRSRVARLEFYTVNAEEFGFIANFNTYWFCDENLDTSPGTITSPMYPGNYPNNVGCTTTITAPIGHNIVFTIDDLELNGDIVSSPENNDTLRVYSGNHFELDSMNWNTIDIPQEIRSVGRTLFLNFESDGTNTNARGFHASYYFSRKIPETTTNVAKTKRKDNEPIKHPMMNMMSDDLTPVVVVTPPVSVPTGYHGYAVTTYALIGLLTAVFCIIIGLAFLYVIRNKSKVVTITTPGNNPSESQRSVKYNRTGNA